MPRLNPNAPFIVIPSRSKDLRICARRLWVNGATLASGIDAHWPQSITGDDAGGAYALDVVRLTTGAMNLVLSHVDAAGAVTASAVVASKGFTADARAHVVTAAGGSCIVVWSFGGQGDRLFAQRFNSSCVAMWSGATALLPVGSPAPTYVMVGAASDGAGGAVVCALRQGQDFIAQRVNSAGTELWAGTAIPMPGIPPFPPPEAPQIVATGTGFVVVFQLPSMPASNDRTLFGQWLTSGGQLNGGTFTIGTGPERWFHRAGVRRMVSDDNGGFWVALSGAASSGGVPAKPMQLKRFDAGGMTAAVTVDSRVPVLPPTYALAPDGSGGVAVATHESMGSIGVERWAAKGGRVFSVAGATRLTVVTTPALSDVAALPSAHRALAIAKRDQGSFLIAVEDASTGTSRITFRCLDDNGLPIGITNTEISPVAGIQTAIRLTQPPLPSSTPPAPTDYGTVIGTWHTMAGGTQIISAQKLGCCREVYNIDVVPNRWPLRCAIPVDYPPRMAGGLTMQLPCSREDIGTFGILPIPHLSTIPGVNVPGSLVNTRVPAPSWVRLQFSGVPDDVAIGVFGHTGVKVGIAKPSGGSRGEPTIREVMFKPDAKVSYALSVTRAPGTESGEPLTLGIDVTYGHGPRPTPPRRKTRRARRSTRRRARARRRR